MGAQRRQSRFMGGDTGICLFSSFLLFKTRYVRYLMAFRCMFFMRVLMLDFGIFMLASLLMGSSCIPPPCPQTHLGPKLESKTHDKNKEQGMCDREHIQESAKGSTNAKLAK